MSTISSLGNFPKDPLSLILSFANNPRASVVSKLFQEVNNIVYGDIYGSWSSNPFDRQYLKMHDLEAQNEKYCQAVAKIQCHIINKLINYLDFIVSKPRKYMQEASFQKDRGKLQYIDDENLCHIFTRFSPEIQTDFFQKYHQHTIQNFLRSDLSLKAHDIRRWMSQNPALFERETQLNLQGIEITEIPTEILYFKRLRALNLNKGKLFEIPSFITQLNNLERLFINKNQLESFLYEGATFVRLEYLDLGNNPLNEVPLSISQSLAQNKIAIDENIVTHTEGQRVWIETHPRSLDMGKIPPLSEEFQPLEGPIELPLVPETLPFSEKPYLQLKRSYEFSSDDEEEETHKRRKVEEEPPSSSSSSSSRSSSSSSSSSASFNNAN